jgi:hypothetical protein
MKAAVGRHPQTGAPLASQSTISRLENARSRTEAARLSAALLDQFGETVKPGRMEILDIDDTFCAAHGGQRLAFWNAHHDERGFASMHIYHVASCATFHRRTAAISLRMSVWNSTAAAYSASLALLAMTQPTHRAWLRTNPAIGTSA